MWRGDTAGGCGFGCPNLSGDSTPVIENRESEIPALRRAAAARCAGAEVDDEEFHPVSSAVFLMARASSSTEGELLSVFGPVEEVGDENSMSNASSSLLPSSSSSSSSSS